jgi:hypothetical protein
MKTIKIHIKSIMILSVMVSLSSCCTIFGGSRYNATITAKDHPKATIFVNGEKAGVGMVTGTYFRKQTLQVELRQEDCDPKRESFLPSFRAGTLALSFITTGIIGLGIDLGVGSCYKPPYNYNKHVKKIDMKNYEYTIEYIGCDLK